MYLCLWGYIETNYLVKGKKHIKGACIPININDTMQSLSTTFEVGFNSLSHSKLSQHKSTLNNHINKTFPTQNYCLLQEASKAGFYSHSTNLKTFNSKYLYQTQYMFLLSLHFHHLKNSQISLKYN